MLFRSLVLSLTLVALLAGCGLNFGGVSVKFDEALEAELRTLVRTDGATKPLVGLLPGDWDTVHILLGPDTKEGIEREIGRPVELSGSGVYGDSYMQDGNLLVFLKSGEIVRMVSTGQLAVLPTGVFPPDATLHSAEGSTTTRQAVAGGRPPAPVTPTRCSDGLRNSRPAPSCGAAPLRGTGSGPGQSRLDALRAVSSGDG